MRVAVVLYKNVLSEGHIAAKLRDAYQHAKGVAFSMAPPSRVNPRAVFTNNELDLRRIGVYGFDYDYTLAVYTKNLNELVYNLTMHRLVQELKYPEACLKIPADLSFAIRGLHYDIHNCCLLKVDAYNQIQRGTVYRGRRKLDNEEVLEIYGEYSIPENKGKKLPQLIDLFSLPWAGILSNVVHYFDTNKIAFDPVCLYEDVAECVRRVHVTGEMYAHVAKNLNHYVHKNEGLGHFLETLYNEGKELFMITNSPFNFMNTGMTFMLGDKWRTYFKYIVVSARKPKFFSGNTPFRLYNEDNDGLSFEKVSWLQPNHIYAGGNMFEFSKKAEFKSSGVLYFGDHIFTDLADPMLKLGWHTAAIIPELAREIRVQNEESYRYTILWMETLTQLIETYQKYCDIDQESMEIVNGWISERKQLREKAKGMFNPQFGSMFRTFHNMTFFYNRLNRLSDIYTSRLPNLSVYGVNHTFYPRRTNLPHECSMHIIEPVDSILAKTVEKTEL
uniref:5'-nucleotidase domain-containing protein 3 n=1 Tax=Panagrolaimus sp. JU765 TaxID=591449 RepID=A0AC34QT16_9BILA